MSYNILFKYNVVQNKANILSRYLLLKNQQCKHQNIIESQYLNF